MVLPDVSFEGYRTALNKLEEEETLKAYRAHQTKCNVLFWEDMRKYWDKQLSATDEALEEKRW